MEITIRKATTEDFDTVLDILESAALKLLANGIPQWDHPWNKGELLGQIENNEFYIAEKDNDYVGCFGLKNFENNPFTDDNTGLYFYHLAIHPQHNGKGLGERICRWVQNYAKSKNINIYFDCWAGNDFLKNFYKAAGFEYIGDFPEEDYYVSAFTAKQG